MKYLNDYFCGFNEEITKYQWPNPFDSVDAAREMLQVFLNEMERGETLLFSILSRDAAFFGSEEIHGLNGDCPELGIWIKEHEQKKGYAYEALKAVLDYVRLRFHKTAFFYEADVRNTSSMKLLRKFEAQYIIKEREIEKVTADSGKELELQGFILEAKQK